MRKSIAGLIVGSALIAGCSHDEDGGPTVTRNYQVANFQQVEAAGAFDVDIRTGAHPGVSAQGSQKLLENTVVEVEGNKLLIRPKEQGGFHFGWSHRGKAHFTVTVPQLTAATLAGAGDLNIDSVSGDSFEATMAGAGHLTIGSVNLKSLKVSTAGAGDAKIASGQAEAAEYAAVGAGDVDASGVTTRQLKANVAGAGSLKAHATGAADLTMMGAGDITVTGGAKCNITKRGPGDVSCS